MEGTYYRNSNATYVWRSWPINEEEIWVVDSCLYEFLFIVLWLVEAYYARDVKVLEDLEVVFWRVSSSLIIAGWVNGSHEGDKLVGNDEIQIPIFNFLIVLVLFIVEFSEVVPAMADANLEAL